MASSIPGLTVSAKSSGDMSSNQYNLVRFSTTNSAKGCILAPSSAGGFAHGVWLQNSTAAEYGPVQVSGVAKVQVSSASNAISEGSWLTGSTAATGSVVASTSTGGTFHSIGYALEAVSSGSTGLVTVMLAQTGKTDVTG